MTMTEQGAPQQPAQVPIAGDPSWAGPPMGYPQTEDQAYAQPPAQPVLPGAPAPPVPEAVVLEAGGTAVQLRNPVSGALVEAQLTYTMLSLRRLEQRFGSLGAIEDALPKSGTDVDPKDMGPVFTTLADVLAPGLLHVRVNHPDTGAPLRLGTDPDVAAEWMDPAQLQQYLTAFSRALGQAFGALMHATPQMAPSGLTPSPGPSGTTQPPSPSTAQTQPSGP